MKKNQQRINAETKKLMWEDATKALTFKNRNSLKDLVALYKVLINLGDGEIKIGSLKMKGKTSTEIIDLVERLKMLGEVYDPYFTLIGEGKIIQLI